MSLLGATTEKRNWGKITAALFLGLGLGITAFAAQAGDLLQANNSRLAGITFDDAPLSLPTSRNFQMAMITASSELGRSCGSMEAFGWRMSPQEQQRVNQIFNSTVDRMRGQGFVVESKSPTSVSRDVTVFTADRSDKHLVFMWSAGEIGLVLVLCETSAPLPPTGYASSTVASQPTGYNFPETGQALRNKTEPLRLTRAGKMVDQTFSPVGEWVGTYTCAQGTTGGTLRIDVVRGDQFQGTFRFYPTPKNPYIPAGRYTVFGEYDRDSQRILINPGKWIERPKNYFNTIMIGSFDPSAKTFSGFFQGINGCTSFEARYTVMSKDFDLNKVKAKKPVKKKAKPKKPKAAKPEASKPSTTESAATTAPAARESGASFEALTGINVGTEKPAVAPAPTAPPTPSVPPAPGATSEKPVSLVPSPSSPPATANPAQPSAPPAASVQ